MAASHSRMNRNYCTLARIRLLAMSALLIAWPAQAQKAPVVNGDKALGEYLSNTCTGCHQISGQAQAGVPAITGWPEDQFIAVMESYKAKHRENKVMQTIAAGLSAADLAGLAAYYASIKPARQTGK
jgi:cytochrome c553